MLFGDCAALADLFLDATIIFVSPPEHTVFPKNTQTVYLKRHVEKREIKDTNVIWY